MKGFLMAIAKAAGAGWAAAVPCRGEIWSVGRMEAVGESTALVARLLEDGSHWIEDGDVSAQANAITARFVRRRRGRTPRAVLRPGGSPHLALLLERGSGLAAPRTLARALDALTQTLAAREDRVAFLTARLLESDGRACLLADSHGEAIALSPAMRWMLGGGARTGAFVPHENGASLLERIRELAPLAEEGPILRDLREVTEGSFLHVAPVAGSYRSVVAQGPAAREAILRALARQPLTAREVTCGLLLSEGLRYRAIADRLALSPDTVKLHLRALYQKLGVVNREALVSRLAGLQSPGVPGRSERLHGA